MVNMKQITKKSKIILIPYAAQGHVTPILHLATTLTNHSPSLDAIILTPHFIHRKITTKQLEYNEKITFMSIRDELNEDDQVPRDFFTIEKAMESDGMAKCLEGIVCKVKKECGVACLAVDLLASYAFEVGRRCGVPVVGFWTAMFSAYRLLSAIPEMVASGVISDAGIPQQEGTLQVLPDQPSLSPEELPWLIGNLTARKGRFRFWKRTLERCRSLRWLLVNSFPEEDGVRLSNKYSVNTSSHALLEQNNSAQEFPMVVQVGPLSKHAISATAATKRPSFWEEDMSCLQWLDNQKPNSVVYISFGSWVSPIGEGKVRDLSLALIETKRPFLWVLGSGWRNGLPSDYQDRVSKQGKLVSWAPQLEVLRHKAVGCYLTHCGWNSTMEAIQFQKRLLCYPLAADQFLNCAYIVQRWKIGVRLCGFGAKDVEEGLRKVMEDDDHDDGMNVRLKMLYQRTMGEKASAIAISNLRAFCDDVKILLDEKASGRVSLKTQISDQFI